MSTRKKHHVTLFPPSDADVRELAAHMRDSDVEEVALLSGLTPQDAARTSVDVSTICYAMRITDGPLLCIFGAVLLAPIAGQENATIWELGTNAIDQHPVAFMASCRRGLDLVTNTLPNVAKFFNFIPVENVRSARWLESLGATFEPEPITVNGIPVRMFAITRQQKEATDV